MTFHANMMIHVDVRRSRCSNMESLFPSSVASSHESQLANSTKQRCVNKKNSDPKPVLLYTKQSQSISGACVFLKAVESDVGTELITVNVTRVVWLQHEISITRADMLYFSNVFSLTPQIEMTARSAPTFEGNLNSHFVEFAGSSWKVVALEQAQRQTLIRYDGLPIDLIELKCNSSVRILSYLKGSSSPRGRAGGMPSLPPRTPVCLGELPSRVHPWRPSMAPILGIEH